MQLDDPTVTECHEQLTRPAQDEIRAPREADIAGLARHFGEMQIHYSRPVSAATATAAAALACRPAVTLFDPRVLLAVRNGDIAASIVLNVSFPAFELSRSLYIRDLYVGAVHRRQGLGRTLVQAAARLAASQGFSALDWTTETGNHDARAMYESCGARLLHRSYYRLTSEDLEGFADK